MVYVFVKNHFPPFGNDFVYLNCNESPFYIFRFFEYMCSDIFGPRFDISLLERGVEDTNTYYGGLDIEVLIYSGLVTNILSYWIFDLWLWNLRVYTIRLKRCMDCQFLYLKSFKKDYNSTFKALTLESSFLDL